MGEERGWTDPGNGLKSHLIDNERTKKELNYYSYLPSVLAGVLYDSSGMALVSLYAL